jgi:hypothetical protein
MARSKPLVTFYDHLLDRLGDRNPQLLRELRGRVRLFPILLAVGLSVFVQLGVLLVFWMQLPGIIELHELTLTTYPQIEWDSLSGFNQQMQATMLPSETPNRQDLVHSSVFVKTVKHQEAVLGRDVIAQTGSIDQAMKVGDRLVAIDDKPVQQLWENLDVSYPEDKHWKYMDMITYRVRGDNSYNFQESTKKLIGTSVVLTLERAGSGQFTVTLPRIAITNKYNHYCQASPDGETRCQVDAGAEYYLTNWSAWFGAVFCVLTGVLGGALMGFGAFSISSNLAEEQRRGTFNFLRLSPRSPLTLLSGKFLGVPICLYCALLLALPLQLFSGMVAGYGWGYLFGFSVVLVAQTVGVYLLAVVCSLSTANASLLAIQPWLLAGGVSLLNWITWSVAFYSRLAEQTTSSPLLWFTCFSPFLTLIYFANNQMSWASNEINLAFGYFRINFAEYIALMLLHAVGWSYLLFAAIKRRYYNPRAALLKRTWSYPLTLIVVGTLMALCKPHSITESAVALDGVLVAGIAFLYFIVLEMALSGDRQFLLDWLRFRQDEAVAGRRRSQWQALLVSDNSPLTLTIGANLLLASTLFIFWYTSIFPDLWSNSKAWGILLLSILIFIGSILLSVLVNQILLLHQPKRHLLRVSGNLMALVFPVLAFALGVIVEQSTFSGRGLWGLPPGAVLMACPVVLLAFVTTVLGIIHLRQLIVLGRSESQPLLRDRSLVL